MQVSIGNTFVIQYLRVMRPKSKFSSELFYALYDYYRNAVLREFLAPRKIQYSVTSKKITVNG